MTADINPNPAAAELEVVARTVWAEARGEDRLGREAVAAVIANRAKLAARYRTKHGHNHPLFGDGSLVAACQAHWRDVYQFTCWSPRDPNYAKMLAITAANPVYAESLEIAVAAAHGRLDDPTAAATHYLNIPVTKQLYGQLPGWVNSMVQTAEIGDHTFFRGA